VKIQIDYEMGQFTAYLPDEYDGAPDAGPQLVGHGKTRAEALRFLADQIEDRDGD
jgi:hypothetical protein